MPDVKISDAAPAGPLMNTDKVPIARVGTDQPLNASMDDFATYVTVLASTHTPAMSNLPATPGKMMQYARADHAHPPNTALAMLDSPAFINNPTAPTMLPSDSSDALATTKFVHDLAKSGTLHTETPGIDDNSELVATTEYVQNQGSTQPPLMDGVPTAGVSQRFSRGDHTHPIDTSRAAASAIPLASTTTPLMDSMAAIGTGTAFARNDHVHPVDTSRYAANNPAGYVDATGAKAAAPVQSVAARTGAITLTHTDITDWNATLAPYALTTAIPVASTTAPVMDGTAAAGAGTTWARADHAHPTDTSRYAAANPSNYITLAQARAGTIAGDDAAAGQIGEYQATQRLSTNGITLATGVDTALVSLVLTAGDWDVWGSVGFTLINNNSTLLSAWLNPAGATSPPIDQIGGNFYVGVPNNEARAILPVTQLRVSANASTTVTLGATATFGGGTHAAWGKIMARRRR